MVNSSKTQSSHWVINLPCLFFSAAALAVTMLAGPFLHLPRTAVLLPSGRLINHNRVTLEPSSNQVVVNLLKVIQKTLQKINATYFKVSGCETIQDRSTQKRPAHFCQKNCPGNGRPDTGYINWKWKPTDCELPKLVGLAFLELMRGKTLGFIGDSVCRNQYEALMCTLVQVAEPVENGNRKFQRWTFRDYNIKVVRIWSAWLVRHTLDAIDFAPESMTKLHLDTLDDEINDHLPMFDVVVVGSGHWWPRTAAYIVDGKVVGGQSWWNDKYTKQHDALSGYGMAWKAALKAILSHPEYKGLTILRTYSPEHYEGGTWNTGGSCTGKTEPLKESELPQNTYINSMYAHQMASVKDAEQIGDNAKRLRVMNITRPFSYRADGHPGPYLNKDPNKKVERGPMESPRRKIACTGVCPVPLIRGTSIFLKC